MKQVHLVATLRSLVAKRDLINEADKPDDVPASDLAYFTIATQAEWKIFEFIVDNKHLPVISILYDNFINSSPLFNAALSVFPNGMPKSYKQLTWAQKKFLTLVGAETTAVCLDVIPQLYGKVPEVHNETLTNVKQVMEYNTLVYAQAATMRFDSEVIIIHHYLNWFKDVSICFPYLDIKGIYRPYLPTTGLKSVDEYIANTSKKEAQSRAIVDCPELRKQIVESPGDMELNFLRASTKVHVLPSWYWAFFSFDELNQVENSLDEKDLPANLQELVGVGLHEQMRHLKHIIAYKQLPIISALNFVDLEQYQRMLYHEAATTFLDGLPDELDQLSWLQKKFLLKWGAEKLAVFTNIIPRLYGIPQLKFDMNANQANQFSDFKTLHIVQKIAEDNGARNVILLQPSRSYLTDVAQCFPYLSLNQFGSSVTGYSIDQYQQALANQSWDMRPEVNCTHLQNSLTTAGTGNNFHIMVNEPLPTQSSIAVAVAAGLAAAYALMYTGLSIFKACTKKRNLQRQEAYRTYRSKANLHIHEEVTAPLAEKPNQESIDKARFPDIQKILSSDLRNCNDSIADATKALAVLENNPVLHFKKGRKEHLFVDYFNTLNGCEKQAATLSAALATHDHYSADNFASLAQARLDLNTIQAALNKLKVQMHTTKEYYGLGKNSLLRQRPVVVVAAHTENQPPRRAHNGTH